MVRLPVPASLVAPAAKLVQMGVELGTRLPIVLIARRNIGETLYVLHDEPRKRAVKQGRAGAGKGLLTAQLAAQQSVPCR
jgi:hypothetical protein